MDKNKYLIVKPNLQWLKDKDSANWIYNEEKNYSQLLWNISTTLTSLKQLFETWEKSASALEKKSE